MTKEEFSEYFVNSINELRKDPKLGTREITQLGFECYLEPFEKEAIIENQEMILTKANIFQIWGLGRLISKCGVKPSEETIYLNITNIKLLDNMITVSGKLGSSF